MSEEAAPEAAEVVVVGEETPQEAPSAEANESPDEEVEPRWIRGAFEAGYEGYWSKDENDSALHQTLRLQIDPPQYPRLHVRGSLWMTEELASETEDYSALRDIDDAYDSDTRARLLYLYADIDDIWGDSTLRIGRQRIVEGPVFNRIDGIYFSQRREGWDWYAFGGARASVYTDRHDNPALGGGVSYSVMPHTRVALDYYYGEEHRLERYNVPQGPFSERFGFPYPRRVKEDLGTNSVALSAWQDITPDVQAFARLHVNEGDAEALVLDLVGYLPKWDAGYQLTYRGQYEEVWDRVNDMTAYYRELGVHEEFHDWLASVHKGLTKTLDLAFEAQVHNADDDSRYGGNRDYLRLAAILTAAELPKGIDASVALERWDVDGGEGSWTVTGEVTKRWGKVSVTAGADYALYVDSQYAYLAWPNAINQLAILTIPGVFSSTLNPVVLALDEQWVKSRENVHSFYGRFTWDFAANQSVSARIDYERDEGPESPYWHAQVNYAIQF